MNYRLDLFAVFIFLGIVQAIFLCFFFFSKENRRVQANVFQGLMLLAIALCIVEVFLMYTGYIVNCLYLVDFSEAIALLIGPFFYLMVISLIYGTVPRKYYWHLVFPFIYLLFISPFYFAPEDVKYNAWIYAYQPGLPYRVHDYHHNFRLFWITDHATEIILVSLVFYATLSVLPIIRAFRRKKESFWRPLHPVLRKLKFTLIEIVSVTTILVIVKIFNEADTGDHMIGAYIAVAIYVTSFGVVRQSGFFKPASLTDTRYKGSVLSSEVQQNTLQKLREVMGREKPFLSADFCLPDLAQRLGTTVHTLSQVINEGLGKSFFEMAAEYRVEEAKRLLKEQRNIKVEEIADQVGYSSKSSFNSAFKKITGMTPSEFRAS
jgi:AraC-like DNA-binding protein